MIPAALPSALTWLLLLGIGCSACAQREGARLQEAERPGVLPQYESWNVDFAISDGGVPRVRMQAAYMARFEVEDSTYIELRSAPDSQRTEVFVHFYRAGGQESGVLRAREVVYNEDRRTFEARGNVLVTTTDARRLSTESLTWEEEKHEIRTPGFVRIVTREDTLQGYQLRADEDLRTFEIYRPTGSAIIDEEET